MSSALVVPASLAGHFEGRLISLPPFSDFASCSSCSSSSFSSGRRSALNSAGLRAMLCATSQASPDLLLSPQFFINQNLHGGQTPCFQA